jgi:hypothetical protein
MRDRPPAHGKQATVLDLHIEVWEKTVDILGPIDGASDVYRGMYRLARAQFISGPGSMTFPRASAGRLSPRSRARPASRFGSTTTFWLGSRTRLTRQAAATTRASSTLPCVNIPSARRSHWRQRCAGCCERNCVRRPDLPGQASPRYPPR